jgi:prophage regulatory protein
MQTQRIIRRLGLQEMTGLSLATIYRLMHRGAFPRPIALSDHAVGWLVEDVEAWIESRRNATKH